MLWRVAQAQYDLLGLLCMYMIKWKLLMRLVTVEAETLGWDSPLSSVAEDEF